MKTEIERKLKKTVIYRLTASSLAQFLSWVLFHRIEVNAGVLFVDMVQMVYYFFFDSIWGINRDQITPIKKLFNSKLDFRTVLRQRGYSEGVVKEVWKWYDFS
jgi:hypothetical protein